MGDGWDGGQIEGSEALQEAGAQGSPATKNTLNATTHNPMFCLEPHLN